jgi:hypothetical protein
MRRQKSAGKLSLLTDHKSKIQARPWITRTEEQNLFHKFYSCEIEEADLLSVKKQHRKV